MRRYLKVLLLLMFVVVASVLNRTHDADASFVLKLDDINLGATEEVIVADNQGSGATTGSGLTTTHADGSNIDGTLSYLGSVGSGVWTVTSTVGSSTPSNNESQLDVINFSLSSSGEGTLDIWITDTGYGLANVSSITDTITGQAASSVEARGYYDSLNNEFGITDVFTSTMGPYGPGTFDDFATASVGSPGDPFSLTKHIRIVHTAAGQTTSFTNKLIAVPEPGLITLLGISLAGVFGAGKVCRKFKGVT